MRTGPFETGVFRYVSLAGRGAVSHEDAKFTEAQKAFIQRHGEDGGSVAEICRKAGITQATYFNWKKRCVGLLSTETRRPKQLEDENARLKKVLAEAMMDVSARREMMGKNF